MRDFIVLLIHLLVTLLRLLGPGGVRAVAAESLLLKHQLIIVGRSRRRAPNLTAFDRLMLGLAALFIGVRRIPKLAVVLKASTLFRLHRILVDQKYRRLFSSSGLRRKPGPKGPSAELIAARTYPDTQRLKSRAGPRGTVELAVAKPLSRVISDPNTRMIRIRTGQVSSVMKEGEVMR
jgi:hypothetical protein